MAQPTFGWASWLRPCLSIHSYMTSRELLANKHAVINSHTIAILINADKCKNWPVVLSQILLLLLVFVHRPEIRGIGNCEEGLNYAKHDYTYVHIVVHGLLK